MRAVAFLLLVLGCSMAAAQSVSPKRCKSGQDLALRVLHCLKTGDSLGIRALVPTVEDLFQAQDEERTPGAFRVGTQEAEEMVHGIDSVAMASFRKARAVAILVPRSSLKASQFEETPRSGDMAYSDITAHTGKGSLTCALEIKTAMGFSSGWKLGWGGFSLVCVEE